MPAVTISQALAKRCEVGAALLSLTAEDGVTGSDCAILKPVVVPHMPETITRSALQLLEDWAARPQEEHLLAPTLANKPQTLQRLRQSLIPEIRDVSTAADFLGCVDFLQEVAAPLSLFFLLTLEEQVFESVLKEFTNPAWEPSEELQFGPQVDFRDLLATMYSGRAMPPRTWNPTTNQVTQLIRAWPSSQRVGLPQSVDIRRALRILDFEARLSAACEREVTHYANADVLHVQLALPATLLAEYEVVAVEVEAEAHDQGWCSNPSAGAWSWADVRLAKGPAAAAADDDGNPPPPQQWQHGFYYMHDGVHNDDDANGEFVDDLAEVDDDSYEYDGNDDGNDGDNGDDAGDGEEGHGNEGIAAGGDGRRQELARWERAYVNRIGDRNWHRHHARLTRATHPLLAAINSAGEEAAAALPPGANSNAVGGSRNAANGGATNGGGDAEQCLWLELRVRAMFSGWSHSVRRARLSVLCLPRV